ncbi:hypothetical protein THAOC_37404, partial [Thalassiosira oceanica]
SAQSRQSGGRNGLAAPFAFGTSLVLRTRPGLASPTVPLKRARVGHILYRSPQVVAGLHRPGRATARPRCRGPKVSGMRPAGRPRAQGRHAMGGTKALHRPLREAARPDARTHLCDGSGGAGGGEAAADRKDAGRVLSAAGRNGGEAAAYAAVSSRHASSVLGRGDVRRGPRERPRGWRTSSPSDVPVHA